MTEEFTPSINIIEPSPPDAEEQALMDSLNLGMFDNYNDMNLPTADRCYSTVPSLFIQTSDSSNLSEPSPLDDYSGFTDLRRYSPATSGRSSPVEGYSPASSYGDIFPEEPFNDDLRPYWAPQQSYSGPSSPAVSPSLSPLTSAFNEFVLDEGYPNAEQSVLPSGPPSFTRLRSSSHSVGSVSSDEGWVDGVGRGRSASFSATTTNDQFYQNDLPQGTFSRSQGDFQYGSYPGEVQISVQDVGTTLDVPLSTGVSWGMPTNDANGAGESRSMNGSLATGWRYPLNTDQPSTEPSTVEPQATSPSLLTVPGAVGLQRRGACASRRTRSVSDLNALDPEAGRGRGTHRSALSIPNSRSISNSSRGASPHGGFHFRDVQTPASFSAPSPSSPVFEDAEGGSDDGVTVGRRHTFTALRGSEEQFPQVPSLGRASSTGSPMPRGRRTKGPSPSIGLGVFKAESTGSLSSHGSPGGSQQEFQVSQPPSPAPFKAEVASNKIKQASIRRRINVAAFSCPLPTCSSTFTARHNLLNHINSHNKYRPHRCMCGMSFTTQGVLNRHKKKCRK